RHNSYSYSVCFLAKFLVKEGNGERDTSAFPKQGTTRMPVTIQLNDDLADQLQRKAAVRQLSLQEFTIRLLDGALGEITAAEAWEDQNRRRQALIRKSSATGLTAEEIGRAHV